MSPSPYTSDRDALLADLNPPQREAVRHGEGPLLVVAGAGTGKTRVLTRRVAWLVAGGVPDWGVLAITFTNKAAQVLVERLDALLPGHRPLASTFHAFCARMLRRDGQAIGIPPEFTILDRDDQRRLLRDLIRDLGLEGMNLKPPAVAEVLSSRKNGSSPRRDLPSGSDAEMALERLVIEYAKRLKTGHLLDFDDLLLEGLRLLKESEEVGAYYRRRFQHVLVDEYQDTNRVQAELLSALLGPACNLTVVGDPDQSIYRWRGAAVRNILEFESEFPGARRIVLEQNYRSTRAILDAAETMISKNRHRHEKRLFTEREEGATIREIRCRDADDEAAAVADVIRTWREEGYALGDIAVFYRINALSRALEMALRSRQVPYVVVASVEFFQRREIKDVLAYARLVENPADEAAFLRIANVPKRGVGAGSLEKLRRAALQAGLPSLEAARRGLGGVSGRARKGLADLVKLIDEARAGDRAPVAPLLDRLATRSGYRAWLLEQDEAEDVSRIENVDELISFAHEFDRQEEAGDLRTFLERTTLVSDQDAVPDHEEGRVSLMSVHAAKGLEFGCVVIVGAEEDLFPHARNADDELAAEEERRLFYVAMTRAMERLVITHAARRFDWRNEGARYPSPFLRDIPPSHLEEEDRLGTWAGSGSLGGLGLGAPRRDVPAQERSYVREDASCFAPGDRVRHPYFGEGRLADTRGGGADTRVTIDFDAFGRKVLLLSHAKLERCP